MPAAPARASAARVAGVSSSRLLTSVPSMSMASKRYKVGMRIMDFGFQNSRGPTARGGVFCIFANSHTRNSATKR